MVNKRVRINLLFFLFICLLQLHASTQSRKGDKVQELPKELPVDMVWHIGSFCNSRTRRAIACTSKAYAGLAGLGRLETLPDLPLMLIFAALTNKKCNCGRDQKPVQDNVKLLQTLRAVSPVLYERLEPVVPEKTAYDNAPYLIAPDFYYKFVGTDFDEGPSPPYPGCWDPECSNNGFHFKCIAGQAAFLIKKHHHH